MTASRAHRIGRQRVELSVHNDDAASEVYAELATLFLGHVTPVLDHVLTAVCPPDIVIRVDRLEIDVGTVPRDGLMDAIACGLRRQLPAMLRATGGDERDEASRPRPLQRLSANEMALERLGTFLEHGVMTWRDAGFTRDELETSLLELIDSAPVALRRRLHGLPASRVAQRVWAQLSVSGRHRLLACLGVSDPAKLDRIVADWTAVLATFEDPHGLPAIADTAHRTEGWLLERVWMLVLDGGRIETAAASIGEHVVRMWISEVSATDAALLLESVRVEAERLLVRDSEVRRFLVERAARMYRESRSDPHGKRLLTRHVAQPRQENFGAPRDETPCDADEAPRDANEVRPGHELPAHLEENASKPLGSDAWVDAARVAHVRQRAIATLGASRPGNATRTQFGSEPLWVAHAGVVIVWPFLPAFFDACGLTAAKRFVDDAARTRAVLLTAHLATGVHEWSEPDLLLEKTLCGHAIDEPIASAVELRDDERRQSNELLESTLAHWKTLKSSSVDGLRRAFLSRAGTMTAIESGWKLEIPRAGHDVLLDTIPWGIGLVLLPWMEQPLHVEW